VYFTGTFTSFLSITNVNASVFIQDGTIQTATGPSSQRNMVALLDLPAGYTPSQLLTQFAGMNGPATVFSATDGTSLLTCAFCASKLIFSTTANPAVLAAYPKVFSDFCALPLIKQGLYFKASVTLGKPVADALSALNIPVQPGTDGYITVNDQPKLVLSYPLNITTACSPFKLRLKAISFSFYISTLDASALTIGLLANLDFGIGASDVNVYLDLQRSQLRISLQNLLIALPP